MPREVYIDPGIIKDTAEICKSLHLDKKILIVTGCHTYDVGARPVIKSLENDILDGYEDNTFRPKNKITRAEAVATLNRVK